MSPKQQQIRQGDTFLKPATRPAAWTPKPLDQGRVILAYGEVTGHAHEVVSTAVLDRDATTPDGEVPAAALFEDPSDGQTYLLVSEPSTLTHQEHGAIALAPGCYRVVRQVEYTPEAIRQVAD